MPHPLTDLTGQRFASWTVTRRSLTAGGTNKNAAWVCQCDCGNERVVRGDVLRKTPPHCASCAPHPAVTHGMSKERVHRIWSGMLARCTEVARSRDTCYSRNLVVVCDRWKVFENFLADMGLPPSRHHSIDRIEGKRGYEPGNCRWATAKQQARNTERNRVITIGSEQKLLVEWCEHFAQPYPRVLARLKHGWPAELALRTPATRPHSLMKLLPMAGGRSM